MVWLHRVGRGRINSASSGRVPRYQPVTLPTNQSRLKRHKKVKMRDLR